ncbi:MAG: hypothetical protein Q4F60_03285 [Candidatus Saccharibacteria bacterium]|nr:hypothetical protein [Candidatus Saccharibacteria bacterium]
MGQIKHKSKYLKIAMCCAAATLALSNIYIPNTSAAENYFTADGSTLELDEIDPSEPDQRLVSVTLKAAREMTVHSLHGYFTPINDEDEELQRYMSWMDYSSGISHLCYSLADGEFDWNTPDCEDDVAGDEGIHVQAGDPLIYVTFEVKDNVEVMKRSMPVNIDLAVINDGDQIKNITMDAYVRAGHTLSVWKYITGNGTLDVPNVVIGGTDIAVGIVPEPGYELTYLELNGQEITDQIEDDVYKMTAGTESLTFYATFRRIYHVLEGDGGEHIAGSEDSLSFKIDTDVTEFCNQGLLIIDGEYLDMRYDCAVDPENQTIILSANFLNTLELGEHSFEAYFNEPESGSAKASFKIVEKGDDKDDDDSNNSDDISVPNSGVFTSGYGNTEIVADILPSVMFIGFIIVAGILIKKQKQGTMK